MTQVSYNQQRVNQLMTVGFVFHVWQNLPLLVPDGVMCQIDTRRIDVDDDGKGGGVAHLKRLRLIPLQTTTKPIISNKPGFSASNMMLGGQAELDATKGQPGYGLGISGGGTRNVRVADSPPFEKVEDLTATFGKYGLIGINSVGAQNSPMERRAQEIFAVVMNGLDDRTLLEDLPEYFGDFPAYLPEKRPRGLPKTENGEEMNAAYFVEKAASSSGLQITPRRINVGDPTAPEGYASVLIGEKPIKLNATEYTAALELIEEIKISVATAHLAAIGDAPHSVLPKTREGRQTGEKKSLDALDRWMMAQFPSFSMDTEIEKANNQIIRALEGGERGEPQQGIPVDVWLEEKRRNDELQAKVVENNLRLEELEKKFSAAK